MDLKIRSLVLMAACAAATVRNAESPESNVRIVGGQVVDIRTVPYQVSLSIQYGRFLYHACGGSILNEITILTAAHCVSGGSRMFVRAGSTVAKTGGQLVEVANVIVHPQNAPHTLDSDIAVVKLKQRLLFNEAVKPIKLADSERFYQPGVQGWVTGWGALEDDGVLSELLQGVSVPILNQSVCAKIYASLNTVTERMFCAGYIGIGGKDSCQGDSGGPMTVNGDVLVGVVSWGNNCADPLYPGVYTKVHVFRSWIESLL